jgi:starch synthase
MKAKKVLFITQEMLPFVPETPKSHMGRFLPQLIQEAGHEIRTFTPKWGIINERRNQLHEVIRLSGMNLIIDETDHPLIIKVASIPQARMQIYFIDNDDYFMRRKMAVDDDGEEYADNGERAIFFARGVLETVKKLLWVPDVIHCYGWISALAPLYIKKAYADEPSFRDTKVVFSASSAELKKDFGRHTAKCIPFKDAKAADIQDVVKTKFGYNDPQKLAIKFSDGVVLDDEKVSKSVIKFAEDCGVPVLPYQGEDFASAYSDFYESL